MAFPKSKYANSNCLMTEKTQFWSICSTSLLNILLNIWTFFFPPSNCHIMTMHTIDYFFFFFFQINHPTNQPTYALQLVKCCETAICNFPMNFLFLRQEILYLEVSARLRYWRSMGKGVCEALSNIRLGINW